MQPRRVYDSFRFGGDITDTQGKLIALTDTRRGNAAIIILGGYAVHRNLIATSIGLTAALMFSGTAIAATLDPYVLSCDVEQAGDIEVIGSGLGKKPLDASYKLKYTVDPASKSVTSLLSFSPDRGNYEKNTFVTDVRALSSLQLVFCLDEENRCEHYDKPAKGGSSTGQVKGQISLHVVDLKSGTISFSERMVIQSATQTGVINKETVGQCSVEPA